MSFQITVLKVLAGQPDRQATLVQLRTAVAILMSSGKDWTERVKRLAGRVPNLDIFSQGFVLRDANGWRITEAGLALLASIESPPAALAPPVEQANPAVVTTAQQHQLFKISSRRMRRKRRRIRGASRLSVA